MVFQWQTERDIKVVAMSGSFCGCPMWDGKYKRFNVSDGVLVIMEEVAL
jgi:hypothetical protein